MRIDRLSGAPLPWKLTISYTEEGKRRVTEVRSGTLNPVLGTNCSFIKEKKGPLDRTEGRGKKGTLSGKIFFHLGRRHSGGKGSIM